MNQFTIEKNTSGYKVNVKYSRFSFLKAFISGSLTLEMDKDTASSVSNALYTPKAKKSTPFPKLASAIKAGFTAEEKPAKESIATDEQVETAVKPAPKKRAPRKKAAATPKADK